MGPTRHDRRRFELTLPELRTHLREEFDRVRTQVRGTEVNRVRSDLPVVCEPSGEFRLLPASSVAVQALVPADTALHDSLLTAIDRCHERFPTVAEVTFWQPPGTFHLNIVILRRLSPEPFETEERDRLLHATAPLVTWMDGLSPFEVEFRGTLLRDDGTIMAVGFPVDTRLWEVRREAVDRGFPDQQGIVHITLGRILAPIPAEVWREFVAFVEGELAEWPNSTFEVQKAILIDERLGFLHTPECYTVLHTFEWGTPGG